MLRDIDGAVKALGVASLWPRQQRTLGAATALQGTLAHLPWIAIGFGALTLASGAAAAPQNGQIVAGQAQIIQKSPGEIDIIQKSGRLVLDWASFNLAAGETVRFIQGTNEVALNEIAGGASTINGNLFADARLILVNAAGISFGTTAKVQVGSLVATTANIAVPDFLNGRYAFTQAGQSNAIITNAGSITAAQGGLVALVAPAVANSGVISARFGKVALASGNSFFLDLYGDHLVNLVVGDQVAAATGAQVSNSGQIIADGGRVELSAAAASGIVSNAINMSGVIEARAVASHGGTIVLEGNGGAVEVAGTLDASGGAGGQVGGTVKVLGNAVTLDGTARIDVSGPGGGGTALVGGNFHGMGPEENAQTTTVSLGATIDADATGLGNGGQVAIWADGVTSMAGTITARGGVYGGAGGLIETSGHLGLVLGAVAPDASAAQGHSGAWLIDPEAVVIGDGTQSSSSGGTTTLGAGQIVLALTGVKATKTTAGTAGTDVIIETNIPAAGGGEQSGAGSIAVDSALIYNSTHSLLLLAQGAISVQASIQNTDPQPRAGGTVALVAGWDGRSGGRFLSAFNTGGSVAGVVSAIAAANGFGQVGGDVLIGSATGTLNVAVGSMSGPTIVLARDATLQGGTGTVGTGAPSFGQGSFAQIGANVFAAGNTAAVIGTGAIEVLLTGGLTLAGGAGQRAFTQIGHGGFEPVIVDVSPIIVSAGGDIVLQGGGGQFAYAQIGHGGAGADLGVPLSGGIILGGDIVVTAGGNVRLVGGGSGAYAQIGHGGLQAGAFVQGGELFFGNVTVNAGGNVALTGGSAAYAQIGLGGLDAGQNVQGIPITIVQSKGTHSSSAGTTTPSTGSGTITLGTSGFVTLSGDVMVSAHGGVALAGGISDQAYAQIGAGGDGFGSEVTGSVSISGKVAVNAGAGGVALSDNLSFLAELEGGSGSTQIGNGGSNAFQHVTGLVSGKASTGSVSVTGDVTVQTTGSVNLQAGFTFPASPSSPPSPGFAQIGLGGGFAGDTVTGSVRISGNLSVNAAGDVILTGGRGGAAQIGNGGFAADEGVTGQGTGTASQGSASLSGAIMVSAGGAVEVLGGNSGGYAQIGHGGFDAALGVTGNVSLSGPVTVSAGGVVLVQGGAQSFSQDAYAQIGLGGDEINGTNGPSQGVTGNVVLAGAVSVIGGAVELFGGNSSRAYAQLGDGGFGWGATSGGTPGAVVSTTGNIQVSATLGNITLRGGSGPDADAQIGQGGIAAGQGAHAAVTDSGEIVVRAIGGVTLFGGLNTAAEAQIGQGGFEAADAVTGMVSLSGDVAVSAGRDIVLAGGASLAYAQIGHGGGGAANGVSGAVSLGGNIGVNAAGNVTVVGQGAAFPGAYAQIGHGGGDAMNTISGTLNLNGAVAVRAGVAVNVTGGGGQDAYAQIGFGGDENNGTMAPSQDVGGNIIVAGDVSVTGASVMLQGGGGNHAYAQIGHGGFGWGSSSGGTKGTLVSTQGNILVHATGGDVTLAGGGGNDAYVQIGQGGAMSGQGARGAVLDGGAITVLASGNVVLIGGTSVTTLTTATTTSGSAGTTTTTASVTTTGGYAQIGSGGFAAASTASAGVSLSGAIAVNAGGDVMLMGGGSTAAVTQTLVGTSGSTMISTTITTSSVPGIDTYTQIGHGGFDALSKVSGTVSLSGAVTVNAGGNVVLQGGSQDGYAQIGLGGDESNGTMAPSQSVGGNLIVAGDVSVTGASVVLQGGGGSNAYAQLGDGGFGWGSSSGGTKGTLVSTQGNILVHATGGDVTLAGGGGNDAYAQIGQGGAMSGQGALGTVLDGGAITVSASGNVALVGGTSVTTLTTATTTSGTTTLSLTTTGGYAQIGSGGFAAASTASAGVSLSGAIAVNAGGDVMLMGAGSSAAVTQTVAVTGGSTTITTSSAPGIDAYTQIGHGGFGAISEVTEAVTLSGAVTVKAAGNVALQGGGQGGYAQIGNAGAGAGQSDAGILEVSGQVSVAVGRDLTLAGGSGANAYVQIGHGGFQVAQDATDGLSLSGIVMVSVDRNVTLSGGAGSAAYVQIGHGGFQVASGVMGNVDLAGAVTVSAGGALMLAGGAASPSAIEAGGSGGSDAYVQIGLGGDEASGTSVAGSVGVAGNVAVTGGVVLLTGGGVSAAYAQIGNGGVDWGSFAQGGSAVTTTGSVSVRAASGSVVLQGGSGQSAYAQIGDGGAGYGQAAQEAVQANGAVMVTAFGDIGLLGGLTTVIAGPNGTTTSTNAYAQIGNGGASAGSGASGPVSLGGAVLVSALGNIALGGTATTAATNGNGVTIFTAPGIGAYLQIGNGGLGVAQNVTGNVSLSGAVAVRAPGAIQVSGTAGQDAYAQIGLGGDESNGASSPSQGVAGTITVTGDVSVGASSVQVTGGLGQAAYAQLGDGGFGWASNSGGTAGAVASVLGNITVHATAGDVVLTGGGGQDAYVQIGLGGGRSGLQAQAPVTESGSIAVTASGNVLIIGGTASTVTPTAGLPTVTSGADAYAQIGNGGFAVGQGVIGALDLAGSVTVNAGLAVALEGVASQRPSAGTVIASGTDAYVQIGNGGDEFNLATATAAQNVSGNVAAAGGVSVTGASVLVLAGGNIRAYAEIGGGGFGWGSGSAVTSGSTVSVVGNDTVHVTGGVLLNGGNAGADAYAQIGNGAPGALARGTVMGSIDLRAGGVLSLTNGATAGSVAFIGDAPSLAGTGSPVLILAQGLSDNGVAGIGAGLTASIVADLVGGAVTVATTGPQNDLTASLSLGYSSSNALNLLATGNLAIAAPIVNGGNGAVNLVAGWDGHSGSPPTANGSFAIASVLAGAPGTTFGAHERAVTLGGSVTTDGGVVTSKSAVVLTQTTVTIDTTDGGMSLGGTGTITLGDIEGTTIQGNGLVLAAGGGDVVLLRGGGAAMQLGPVTITSARNVVLGTASPNGFGLHATTLAINATGSVTGNVDLGTTLTMTAASADLFGDINGLTGTAALSNGEIALTTLAGTKGKFTFDGVTIP